MVRHREAHTPLRNFLLARYVCIALAIYSVDIWYRNWELQRRNIHSSGVFIENLHIIVSVCFVELEKQAGSIRWPVQLKISKSYHMNKEITDKNTLQIVQGCLTCSL